MADHMMVAEGSLAERRAVLLYGRDGVTVAAASLDAPRELEPYADFITRQVPFPPALTVADRGEPPEVIPLRFTGATGISHEPEAEVVARTTVST